jgi:hypothetical protein
MQIIKNIFNMIKNFLEKHRKIMTHKHIFIDEDRKTIHTHKDTSDVRPDVEYLRGGYINRNKPETIKMID